MRAGRAANSHHSCPGSPFLSAVALRPGSSTGARVSYTKMTRFVLAYGVPTFNECSSFEVVATGKSECRAFMNKHELQDGHSMPDPLLVQFEEA